MLTVKEAVARFKSGRSWADSDMPALLAYMEANLRETIANAPDELLRVARSAGNQWYFDANEIALQYAADYDTVDMAAASIIAVYSRNNQWLPNLNDTRIFLGGDYQRGMEAVWERAQTLLALNTGLWQDYYSVVMGKSAFKESGFADNIMYPDTSIRVTLDRWMFRAMGIAAAMKLKFEHWLMVEDMFNRLASEYGFEHGHQLQAFVWVIIRDGKVV